MAGGIDHSVWPLYAQATSCREQAKSFGNNPADKALHQEALAEADIARLARLAGHKPLLRRLLERLRPHRQEPGSEQTSSRSP